MSTKEKILAFSTTLLKQNGYHGWSYEHISQEIGIKKASIHYHFPTKAILVAEALKLYIETFFLLLDDISKNVRLSREKLQELFRLYQHTYNAPDEICLCTILAADFHRVPEEVTECLKTFNKDLYQWISEVLKQGINNKEFKSDLACEAVAYLIINVLQGLLISSTFLVDNRTFELCCDQIFTVLA